MWNPEIVDGPLGYYLHAKTFKFMHPRVHVVIFGNPITQCMQVYRVVKHAANDIIILDYRDHHVNMFQSHTYYTRARMHTLQSNLEFVNIIWKIDGIWCNVHNNISSFYKAMCVYAIIVQTGLST